MPTLSRRMFLGMSGGAVLVHALSLTAQAAALADVAVYRNPGCGCCEVWAERMKAAGFAVTITDDAELAQRRAKLGIPADLAGCHLSLIGDQVFEGHVPPADIIAFLAAKTDALGLAVPGMPMGSPGMETGGQAEAYDVMMIGRDGSRSVFARH